MATLTPQYSAHRAVREYTEKYYLTAATAYHDRAANKGSLGRQIVDWHHDLDQKWAGLRFGDVKIETRGDQHAFEVQVYLNDLDAQALRVELYADGLGGGDAARQEMKCLAQQSDKYRPCVFQATVTAARPASDYTARIMPHHFGVAVPLEADRILWQR
jgi:starch phosphorylase